MTTTEMAGVEIHPDVVDAIGAFPVVRAVSHCGQSFAVSPFA